MTDPAFRETCPFCREPLLVGDSIYHEVLGWERRRSQGGTNALRLRQRTGKMAHRWCVDKAAQGHAEGQGSLWSESQNT